MFVKQLTDMQSMDQPCGKPKKSPHHPSSGRWQWSIAYAVAGCLCLKLLLVCMCQAPTHFLYTGAVFSSTRPKRGKNSKVLGGGVRNHCACAQNQAPEDDFEYVSGQPEIIVFTRKC